LQECLGWKINLFFYKLLQIGCQQSKGKKLTKETFNLKNKYDDSDYFYLILIDVLSFGRDF
jgi:hypothetical protein